MEHPNAYPASFGDGFDDLPEAWLRSRPGVKWASAGPEALPCWVADMDFPAPLVARRALARLGASGDLGYATVAEGSRFEERWAPRMAARYGWGPEPGRLRLFSDLVQALQALLHVMTSPGDGVLVLTPCYSVFAKTPEEMGRRLLPVPAQRQGDHWGFDLAAARVAAPQAKVLLLINPHNPTGRVLSRDELVGLAEIAEEHDLLVISDEVHSDLVLAPGRRHVPFASLGPGAAQRTVTLYSASKAFNLGGMCCAVAHVGSQRAAAGLAGLPSHLLGRVGVAAVATTWACWSPGGDAWLERCLDRLRANRDMISAWLSSGPGAAAGVGGYPPEATYLAWLDFGAAHVQGDPAQYLLDQAQVMMTPGPEHGPGGTGFARLNFATTPDILSQILDRVGGALGT